MSEVGIDDETLELTLHSDERIRLCLNPDAVRVVNSQGMELGKFVFDRSEGAENRITWRLTHMFLEGQGGACNRQGIGTCAVRYFLRANMEGDFKITENDGIRREDESRLTWDGAAFMAHLGRLKAAGQLFA